ncbi:MAG TPA: PhoH family protein [Kiloniellaceae bacterium]|nr:PhoH family protein [Kiloniellaceae bacterium]
MSARGKDEDGGSALLEFEDHGLLPLLFGEHDQNLYRLEQQLDVSLASRGNHLQILGGEDAVKRAAAALRALYDRLVKGLEVGSGEVDAAVRMVNGAAPGRCGPEDANAIHDQDLAIVTRKRSISPRSPGQAVYVEALRRNEIVFGIGPAGTGKTYLAVAHAVSLFIKGEIERIILSRPAVEAGERLGFLPGDLLEKVDPYLRPLYDALHDMLPGDQVASRIADGIIEVAPLAFMRGRTLSNAFVILDEAQNTSPVQMKMFLTRLGENSRMAVTGDLTQIDLPKGQPSGLLEASRIIGGMKEVAVVNFSEADVVRHALVARIVQAYSAHETRGRKVAQEAGRRREDGDA